MPLPDVHVRIFDGDEGTRVLPANEVGEICVSGAAVDGRLLEPARAKRPASLRDHVDDDGGTRRWLHTGDLGYLDEDGYLFIVDRKKDLIKTSGFQVWPREIEEVLAAHPAVAEVGVAGVPDAVKGEVVHAWVVLRDGPDARPSRSCARSAASASRPTRCRRAIEFRTELPKTMVGKVLRRALRDDAASPGKRADRFQACTTSDGSPDAGGFEARAKPRGQPLGARRVAVHADRVGVERDDRAIDGVDRSDRSPSAPPRDTTARRRG